MQVKAVDRSHAHLDFHAMVLLNREIRNIVGIAGGVNLSAMNAMLIAKRSGESARGFSVVSRELQQFSRKLELAMQALNGQIYWLLMRVAQLSKQRRMSGHHALAARGSEAAKAHLVHVLDKKAEEIEAAGREMGLAVDALLTEVGRARKLCEMSIALSRAAKIEAVYGGAQAASLRQVAENVEATIAEIINTLQRLGTRLSGETP